MSRSPWLAFSPFLTLVFVLAAAQKAPASFNPHSIDLDFAGIAFVRLIDLDRDGDLDIVGGSEDTPYSSSRGLAWWRNDRGHPLAWTRHAIDPSFGHVMSVDAADVDGDGWLDVIATSWSLGQVAWWKSRGEAVPTWTKFIVRSAYASAHDARGFDIDKDLDADIVTAGSTPGSIDISYNQGGNPPTWTHVQVSAAFTGAKSISIVDLDGDGDWDIVGTASDLNDIAWWRNVGANTLVWQKSMVDNNFGGACHTDLIDMTGDGRLDVIGAGWSSNQISRWNCVNLATGTWSEQVVTTTLDVAVRACGGDFDLDGDVDIAAVGKAPGRLSWYESSAGAWSEHVLSSGFSGGAALAVADLDFDDDLDIVAGAGILGDLLWWENEAVVVGVADLPPVELLLEPNIPNPFNPATVIRYQLRDGGRVRLSVYDARGRPVRRLVDAEQPAGLQSVRWDGTDDAGRNVASGAYFCRLQCGEAAATLKVSLLR